MADVLTSGTTARVRVRHPIWDGPTGPFEMLIAKTPVIRVPTVAKQICTSFENGSHRTPILPACDT